MLNLMYNHLNKNPFIGYISGLIGMVCFQIHSWLTDEALLKLVSSVGVWAGAAVAVLSAIVYLFKVARLFRGVYKRWRNPPLATLIIAGMVAVLFSGCGARKVELQTSRSKVKLDSSYYNSTFQGRSVSTDSATSLWSKAVKGKYSVFQSVDTGRVESTNKTTIAAQFAPNSGPTAAEIAAAAGDQAKTAQLMNRAISLSLTTDQKLNEQKGLSIKYVELASAIDEYTYQAKMLSLTRDSIIKAAEGRIQKETDTKTKDKTVDREAWPGLPWIIAIGIALVVVLLLYYFIFRKR